MSHTAAESWGDLPVKATAVGIVGDQGASFTVYEKNWICKSCSAENHARRQRCLRCKSPKPVDADSKNLVVTPELSKFLQEGGSDWKEVMDPKSNHLYYVNVRTGVSQWERPSELGATPMASGWFGRGTTDPTKESTSSLNARWMTRPARVQVEMGTKVKHNVEGNQEYNIWYGKFIGENWRQGQNRDPAEFRCDPEKDAGYTKAKAQGRSGLFCIHFARGFCGKGSNCPYFHRLPERDDEVRIGDMHDIFGRERHRDHREDMDGVGSFDNPCRTLYVAGINKMSYKSPQEIEKCVRRHFEVWGEVEHINVVSRISTAFVRYRIRAMAEFAKEAMRNQALEANEVLNVRWARDDPNPVAQEAIKRANMDAAVSMLEARGININPPENPNLEVPDDYTLPAPKRQKVGDMEVPAEYLYPDTEGQFNESGQPSNSSAPLSNTGSALSGTGSSVEVADDSEWQEVFDRTYQRNYYYNQKTGESSWTDPRPEAVASSEINGKEAVAETSGAGSEGKQQATDSQPTEDATEALPGQWQKVLDPTYQRYYYYNPETKVSTWELPEAKGRVDEPGNADSSGEAIAS